MPRAQRQQVNTGSTQEEQREQRRQMGTRIQQMEIEESTRQILREALASGSQEQLNMVQRLLAGDINVEQFKNEFRNMEAVNESWKNIGKIQREIREKIEKWNERIESYAEALPQNKRFESLLKKIRRLNYRDDKIDQELKRTLAALAQQRDGRPPIITGEQASNIYGLDPRRENILPVIAFLNTRETAEQYRTIRLLKKQEGDIDQEANNIINEFDKIVKDNFSAGKKKQMEKKIKKNASKTTGIALEVGTVMQYNDPENVVRIFGDRPQAEITDVSFEDYPIRDHITGKVIDRGLGTLFITVGEGSNAEKMSLGRFKKWVDATDAEEVVPSWLKVQEILPLKSYGLDLNVGDELWYKRPVHVEQGSITYTPTYVRISKTDANRVYFSSPVFYHNTLTQLTDPDMYSSMTFGQFAKWWRRQEVEKSVTLEGLRKALEFHNKEENKMFDRSSKDFPPILVKEKEELRFEDEDMGSRRYKIAKVSADGIVLDDGNKYDFPEFLSWVRTNNVVHAPERPLTPAEQKTLEDQHKALKLQKESEEIERQEAEARGIQRELEEAADRERKVGPSLMNRVKKLWWGTTFLSFQDIWKMIVEVNEFIKRKHERRSKGRYGKVGKRLPWVLGTEFERVAQSAENEEVNKYKEAMEQWGEDSIKSTLYKTSSSDIAKACIQSLVDKGEMRWDSPEFWETMNRLTARYTMRGAELYIPPPHLMPQGESGEDMAMKAMDAIWGEGGAADWYQSNISKYNSSKSNFEYKFKQLENDPKGIGGPAGALEKFIYDWRHGSYVHAAEYEEMVDAAIQYGKMGAESKMFYIIAGVMARQGEYSNPPGGETLLHYDRIGELDSKYLNQFPLLDFFTQKQIVDPSMWDKDANDGAGGWGKKRKLRLEDLVKWKDEYFAEDFKKGKPGPGFSRFMWEVMLMEENVRTRITKGLRNAENIDHDDAHLFIPPATPSEIDELTMSSTGTKKKFTNAGYMNGYAGFNHYIVSLRYAIKDTHDPDERGDRVGALADAVNSFIRYDLILDNRLHKKAGNTYARLDDRHYDRPPVVDDVKLSLHRDQLRNLILELGEAYGVREVMGEDLSFLYGPETKSMADKEQVKLQEQYEAKVDGIKDVIRTLIMEDGGQKALEVIRRAQMRDDGAPNGLRGLTGSRTQRHKEEKQRAGTA